MNKLLVIGSINMDFLIDSDELPKKGETVIGNSINYLHGGKGANQAVAAAKMGADVSFMGCVGDDEFGSYAIENLKNHNINTDLINVKKGTPTGIASVTVSKGDNSIVVIKGANDKVDDELIRKNIEAIKKFDYILLQNEIPFTAIKVVIDLLKETNCKIIYNPAPFINETIEVINDVDFIIPNEIEAKKIGINSNNMIITLGEKGVQFGEKIFKSFKVDVVDTTGAGDTFSGVLTAFLMMGYSTKESIIKAQKASSIAIGKKGAQTGMPYLSEIL